MMKEYEGLTVALRSIARAFSSPILSFPPNGQPLLHRLLPSFLPFLSCRLLADVSSLPSEVGGQLEW
ncbi:hypothetical protein NQZ68_013173 [Dissostichus eleginoides]|nr:hypothetical protein NQZ68_013173 [Dissostichus eleginoides]